MDSCLSYNPCSYYSSQAFVDFGFPNIFISCEVCSFYLCIAVLFFIFLIYLHNDNWMVQTFGWTPQEAKLHMVPEFFSEKEVVRF